jgi:uncharacterized protein (TIGR02453 family)
MATKTKPPAGGPFRGFPQEGMDFFARLEADNNKQFWQASKTIYEASVRGPMEALLAELEDEFGAFHVFRPYNDVRFSKNKAPYKTQIGAVAEGEGGCSFYLHVDANGLYVGCGYYHMASDQLDRFRQAAIDDARGQDLERRCAALAKQGYTMSAMEELKTAPRGIPRDHPRIELLRRKGLIAGKQFAAAAWMHTAKAKAKVADTWRGAAPVTNWLDENVGPSTLPPENAERW